MWSIIGSCIVIFGVIGGYLLERGNLSIIVQPVEMMIIFGAALGALVTSAGKKTKDVLKAAVGAFTNKGIEKEDYFQYLSFFYEMAQVARKEGLLALEQHVDNPSESSVFQKYEKIQKDKRILDFMCDNIKLSTFVNMESKELNSLMELEIDTILEEEEYPAQILTKIGDSLPGLGIVAAVLGVVITMGYIAESPEVIGHHVAVALVGTFSGILACYGFIGPIANSIEQHVAAKTCVFNVVRVCIIALVAGVSPAVLVEYGRRAVPPEERVTVAEIEEAFKNGGK